MDQSCIYTTHKKSKCSALLPCVRCCHHKDRQQVPHSTAASSVPGTVHCSRARMSEPWRLFRYGAILLNVSLMCLISKYFCIVFCVITWNRVSIVPRDAYIPSLMLTLVTCTNIYSGTVPLSGLNDFPSYTL